MTGDPDLNHEMICHVRQSGRLLGFLAIHSLFRGSARGGIRMAPDISEQEVRILAEGMTLKFGLLGLPQGGAKAGIRADPDAPEEERCRVLYEFGSAILPLLRNRVYLPGPDMGTSNEMVRRMLVSHGVPVRRRELRGVRSGHFTALSVFHSAAHAASAIGLPLAGSTVAIEGFGKVGSSLAALFAGASARVAAVSTSHGALYRSSGLDVEDLLRAYGERGSRFVLDYGKADRCPREQVFQAHVDILCPCARHNTVTAAGAGGIQARLISSGSNHPYGLDTERELVRRGILCLPYWIANCGGTLGETMEFAGWNDADIAEFVGRRLKPHVRWIIRESQRTNLTPTEIAKPRTLARFAELSRRAAHTSLKARLLGAGLECYRRGLVPPALVRALSRGYFEGNVLLPFDSAD